jgi:hypothetical protein
MLATRALYQAGLDGTGTTIAIVDAYGSTTIAQDAPVRAGTRRPGWGRQTAGTSCTRSAEMTDRS